MKKTSFKRRGLKLVLLAALALPKIVSAQNFLTSGGGDLDAGFRKTGTFAESYETVAYLGNVTNFLGLTAGTTTNITNYSTKQLTNMCPDNFGNLQWSAFSSFLSAVPLTTPVGAFPAATCWYTVPRTNVTVRTTPVSRFSASVEGSLSQQILSVATGANTYSQESGATNLYNNTLVILELKSLDPANLLTTFIGDPQNTAYGDFAGQAFSTFTVENTTPAPFISPAISDFYVNVPIPTRGSNIDPLTGLATGPADYLGYFTLNTNATLAFTRGFSFSGSATNGAAPLKVAFSTTATNSVGVTNWVWNFGNGTIITNTTGGNVTNTYTAAGSYTVTLTLNGTNGSAVVTVASYVVVTGTTPTPAFSSETLAGGKLILNGTNGTASAQYRILATTNLTLAVSNWPPVYTNNFLSNGSFSYTNTSPTNKASFYRLISP